MTAKLPEEEVIERESLAFMRKHLFVARKQLDKTSFATSRAAGILKSGDNNAKEAKGLQLLFDAIQQDGRLISHKSFEKAFADFCVYKPGQLALGIQVKTTGVDYVESKTGYKYFHFTGTKRYNGLLIVCIALHTTPPRVWLADGSKVLTCISIPIISRSSIRNQRVMECTFTSVAKEIVNVYDKALSGVGSYVLRGYLDHERPTDKNELVEYSAFKRLELCLPLNFVHTPSEHMVYDYVVEGKKWQLKVAQFSSTFDRWAVCCFKNAGTVHGRHTRVQYSVDDFDYLCIQFPTEAAKCCYVIPQAELLNRRLIGDITKHDSCVTVYPHRSLVSTKKNIHTGGKHWTEAFRVNFDDEPMKMLRAILDKDQ